MKLMHGSKQPFVAHIGLCLTDNRAAAFEYARDGMGNVAHLTAVELDLAGLRVGRVDGFDAEGAAGDLAAELAEYAEEGWDVLRYTDESYNGVEHETWRIVSQRALDRVRVLGSAR